MAMIPGADLDSLPVLDNLDNFVLHAYVAFILELSYVAINNLPQLNSSGVILLPQLQGNACSSLVCQMFCSTVCKKPTFKWTRPFQAKMFPWHDRTAREVFMWSIIENEISM